jgi:hypothetical protein
LPAERTSVAFRDAYPATSAAMRSVIQLSDAQVEDAVHFCTTFDGPVTFSAERAEFVVSYSLRYFAPGSEFESFNPGWNYASLLQLGYKGYPAFSLRVTEHTHGVLEAFLRRVAPRNRSDFDLYRQNFRISPDAELSDFGLLAVTEAKLPSDGFSVVDMLDPDAEQCDLLLEIAGFRYYVKNAPFLTAAIGERVELAHEPTNHRDPNAVEILVRGVGIGYMNRLQARTFLQWMHEGRVSCVLERLNGNSDRPRAFIFAHIRSREEAKAA